MRKIRLLEGLQGKKQFYGHRQPRVRPLVAIAAREAVFLAFLIALSSASVLAFTPVSSCADDPNTAGEWRLVNDMSTADDACLDVSSDDVVVDCQGHSMTWNGTGIGKTVYGVHALGQPLNHITNLTIRNCTLQNFSVGMELERVTRNVVTSNTLRNTYVHGFGTSGMSIKYSNNTFLVGNSVADYAYSVTDQSSTNLSVDGNTLFSNFEFGLYSNTGLQLVSSAGGVVEGNVFRNIPTGAYLDHVQNMSVRDNAFANHIYGLFVGVNSKYNTVYNNTVNSPVDYGFFVRGSNNSFSRNTLYTGGVLEDLPGLNNTYCANVGNRYLNGSGKDRARGDCGPMPNADVFLVDPANGTPIGFDANVAGTVLLAPPISEAVENTNTFRHQTVLVQPGVYNETMFFTFLNHTTLDCQGSKIHPKDGLVNGITIRSSFNTTIQNCVIEDFTDGRKAIHATSSEWLTIRGNDLLGNGYGAFIDGIGDFLFLDNLVFNNNPYGLFIDAPLKGGFVSGNTFARNAVGMFFVNLPVGNLTIAYNNIDQTAPYQSIVNGQSGNISAKLSWWGTTNETPISESITDFFDNPGLGVVDFHPFLGAPVSPISYPFLSSTLPPNTINKFSSHQLVSLTGPSPYTWAVVNGTPPTGMALHPDGILNGTPTELGNFTFTAEVTDGANNTEQATLLKEIVAGIPENLFVRKWGTIPVPGRVSDYFIFVENRGGAKENVTVAEFLQPWFMYVSAYPEPTNVSRIFIPANESLNLTENITFDVMISWVNLTLNPGEYRVLSYKVLLGPTVPVGTTVSGTACGFTAEDWKICGAAFGICVGTAAFTCLASDDYGECIRDGALACELDVVGCLVERLIERAIGVGGSGGGSGGSSSCHSHDDDTVTSRDPNEKGVTANRYILPNQTLVYPIHFENVGNVSALDVFVDDTLEPALNLSTLEVFSPVYGFVPLRENETLVLFNQTKVHTVNITIGNTTFEVNITVQENWTVRLEGRTLNWTLMGIELEPNATAEVLLSIRPLGDLPSGTEIGNNATIQFDIVEPLTTNSTLNIIDGTVPNCTMDPLPAFSGTPDINLSWQSTDAVGEIDFHRIFVSENNGPFKLLVHVETLNFSSNETNLSFSYNATTFNATTTGYAFTGNPKSTYGFLCVASDTAGNLESNEAVAEASTQVNSPPVITSTPGVVTQKNRWYRYDLDAADPEGHAIAYSLLQAPAGMTINESTGLIQWFVNVTFPPPATLNGSSGIPWTAAKRPTLSVPVSAQATDSFGYPAIQQWTITVGLPGFKSL